MLAGLHERGFDDLVAAHLNVLQYPGPESLRPSELATRTAHDQAGAQLPARTAGATRIPRPARTTPTTSAPNASTSPPADTPQSQRSAKSCARSRPNGSKRSAPNSSRNYATCSRSSTRSPRPQTRPAQPPHSNNRRRRDTTPGTEPSTARPQPTHPRPRHRHSNRRQQLRAGLYPAWRGGPGGCHGRSFGIGSPSTVAYRPAAGAMRKPSFPSTDSDRAHAPLLLLGASSPRDQLGSRAGHRDATRSSGLSPIEHAGGGPGRRIGEAATCWAGER